MKIYRFNPDWVISPGETLKEVMANNGLTVRAVARMTTIPSADVQAILDGELHITEKVANCLAKTQVPAHLWRNLERAYRQGLVQGKKPRL